MNDIPNGSDSIEKAIREHLAMVHGDNGNYQDEHGIVKAIEDATNVVTGLRVRVDRLEHELKKANEDADALFEWANVSPHYYKCITLRFSKFACDCGLADDLKNHTKRMEE